MSDEHLSTTPEGDRPAQQVFRCDPFGLEIRFLKKLFDVEEAEMFLHLTGNLETAATDRRARRAGSRDRGGHAEAHGGQGPPLPQARGDTHYYAAAPFAHGILEHQVHSMDRELAEIYEEYMWAEKIPDGPPGRSERGSHPAVAHRSGECSRQRLPAHRAV